jgi:hypothetical protein
MRSSACLCATILLLPLAAGSAALGADICTETVPATRFIDGFPAYAQCMASNTSAIYSNDGIATATTSGGTGWIRTQGSGGYQCTELAHRYLYFKWNVASVPNGNAGVWCDGTIPNGLMKATTPVHGDLIILAPGSCGSDTVTGHVAVIDVVNADATVTAVQQNSASRSKYKLTCAACFLHAVANDESAGDAGVPGDGGGVDAAPSDTGGAPTDAPVAMDSGSPRDAAGAGGGPGPSGSGGTVGSGGSVGSGGTGPLATGGVTGSAGSGGAAITGNGGAAGPTATGGAGPGATTGETAGCACRVSAENAIPAGSPPWGAVAFLAFGVLITARRRRR